MEHGEGDVDLLAVEDFAEMFPVGPGPRGALAGDLGDEGVEVRSLSGRQGVTVLEQRPAEALEGRIESLFEAPGLVHRPGGEGDDVELVEGQFGVGKILFDALDEGGGHVDGGAGDSGWIAAVLNQVISELPDGRGLASLGEEDQPALLGIRDRGHIVVAPGAGKFRRWPRGAVR